MLHDVHFISFNYVICGARARACRYFVNCGYAQVSLNWIGKVDVLEYYQGVSVPSASEQHPLPAVMRCRMYVEKTHSRKSRLPISRRNILLRDGHSCQCDFSAAFMVNFGAIQLKLSSAFRRTTQLRLWTA
jgi:hypothetical protein